MYKDRTPSPHQLSYSSVTSYQPKPIESPSFLQYPYKNQPEKYSYNNRTSLRLEDNSDLAFLRNTVGPVSTADHSYLRFNERKKIDTSLRQTMNVTRDLKDLLKVQGSIIDKRIVRGQTSGELEKEVEKYPKVQKKDDRLSKIMEKFEKKNQTKEALKLLEQLKQLKKKQEQLKKQRKNDPSKQTQNLNKNTQKGYEVNSSINFSKKNKVDYYTSTYENKSLSTNTNSPQNQNTFKQRKYKKSQDLAKEDQSIRISCQSFQKIGPMNPIVTADQIISKNSHTNKLTANLRSHFGDSYDFKLAKGFQKAEKNDFLLSSNGRQNTYDKKTKIFSPCQEQQTLSSVKNIMTRENINFSKNTNHKNQQNPSHPSNTNAFNILKTNEYNLYSSSSSLQISAQFKDLFMNKQISINDFILGNNLGEGKFGSVFQAFDKRTKSIYALKKIPKSIIKSHWMIDQFILEVKIQNFCNHPNILSLNGVFDDTDNVYILLQYMEQGTLFLHLKKNTTLNEKQAAIKVKQIASAIQYLHENGIAHRDLKPQNIVMSHGICKLCDFGWATICDERRKTYCGTFDYAAPQILQGEEYDMSVDLWCLGILTYEILVGKAPFYHISRKETMKKIMNCQKQKITYPSSMSYEARSFIEQLLKKNPEQRLKSEDLLNHPFILLADR